MVMQTSPAPPRAHDAAADAARGRFAQRYADVRRFTESLVQPLTAEDCAAQSTPEASPAKWHLAHTTWFFETLGLRAFDAGYRTFDDSFNYLFNSYYNALGERLPRSQRGLLTRPSLDEAMRYRRHVDEGMARLIDECPGERWRELRDVIEIGINHEQQHQELLLTDIKSLFALSPLAPAYSERSMSSERDRSAAAASPAEAPLDWAVFPESVREIGHEGAGFAYDNESPRHRVFLQSFELATRLVTNREFIAFIDDGGYRRPELWLDEGWATVDAQGWSAPMYWMRERGRCDSGGEWLQFTLAGLRPLDPNEPVAHISFFEAEAFARWAGARLPTESEWEAACAALPIDGNFVERKRFHPAPLSRAAADVDAHAPIRQAFGDVWEWTRSQYDPYPGYSPAPGALGEYNGKFMCNQFVLRGGSCATPCSHMRATYRNFFPPAARWQFSGVRLARDRR